MSSAESNTQEKEQESANQLSSAPCSEITQGCPYKAEVLDAFFAEMTVSENKIITTIVHQVGVTTPAGTLSGIANHYPGVSWQKIQKDNNLKTTTIHPKQKLNIITETVDGENFSFKALTEAKVGAKIFLVVKTKNLQQKSIGFKLVQSKVHVFAEVGKPITIQHGGSDITSATSTVGFFSSNCNYKNAADFSDFAIEEITLKPKAEAKVEQWNTALNSASDKSSPTQLVIDAHSNNNDITISYKGGNIAGGSKNNAWPVAGNFMIKAYLVDDQGYVTDKRFTKQTVSQLEQGVMADIHAIIVHRTASSTAKSTLVSFKNGVGTHFLVAKDGSISQTASLLQLTYHVGKIRSRCDANNSCSAADKATLSGFGFSPSKIHAHEKVKAYPDRYPLNSDSVGIEVVASHSKTTGWEKATTDQKKSIKLIIETMQSEYGLTDADVYEHDKISYKTAGEGADLYDPNP